MKKNHGLDWQTFTYEVMVCVLCLSAMPRAWAAPAESGEAVVKLREAEMARQAAEQRCADLSLVLVQTERELEKQRQRYADLYLKAQQAQRDYETLQLRVAPLLVDDTNVASGQALANLLSGLDDRQAEYKRLTVQVRGHGQYLQTVLDALKPSETLRREIQERQAELTRACDRVEALPSLVAGRGGEQSASRECRVLSVNPDLGVVVLDAGSATGVRSGSYWRVMDGVRVVARLRVIEVRSTLSAAMVIEGRVQRLTPAMPVQVGE